MKSFLVLQLAAISTAFVLPNEDVIKDLQVESRESTNSPQHRLPSKDKFLDDIDQVIEHLADDANSEVQKIEGDARNSVDDILSRFSHAGNRVNEKVKEAYADTKDWLKATEEDVSQDLRGLRFYDLIDDPNRPPHDDPDESEDPPCHRPGCGHHKPNRTVYELIANYKYSTKLAAAINKFPELVDALNSTDANYTVFAPTDSAFEKLHHEPSEEDLRTILTYHVSPEFFPAGRVLATRTIPTLLKSDSLGPHGNPQRLATQIGLRGLTVNFVSRIIAINVFGTNGVIHGVDSIIPPPPKLLEVIPFLPSEFSTLELGLLKTGLFEELNETAHKGATLFAPNNFAFKKLGPRVNGFLFSSYGQKYLKALLKYHVVLNQTLYSDAFYRDEFEDDDEVDKQGGPPKGIFHVDLPTLLEDRSLSIDIARYGRLIEIKINAFARVGVPDGVAEDGVLHDLDDVLIPPKKLRGGKVDVWNGKRELTVEDLKGRLERFVERDDDDDEDKSDGKSEPLEL